MEKFFYPKSVCIVGASSKEKSIGYELLRCVKSYGFKGNIYPVNPNADEVLGFKCYKDIDECPSDLDLAIVMAPKKFVKESIEKLLKKNINDIVVITAGFKETGPEGEKLEKEIVEMIKRANGRMIGPNCMGLINAMPEVSLNATFVAEKPALGKIGFFSQSGALGAAVLNSLRETDIRFSHFISAGNKADVNENDLMEFWNRDDNIKILTFYLESFSDGKKFLSNLIENKLTKPIIILKGGRTASGQKAAVSHTGALASQDRVVDAILKQFGVMRVDTVKDMFNLSKAIENFPAPKGNKIAILTNSGGPAILLADECEKRGLELSQLSENTKSKLKEIVNPEGSVNNPVDLLPMGDAETFKNCAEILLDDNNVDGLFVIFTEPAMLKPFPIIEAINSVEKDKPIYSVVFPLPEFWQYYKENSKTNKPLFKNVEDLPVIYSVYFKSINKKEELKKYSNRVKENEAVYVKFDESDFNEAKILSVKKTFEFALLSKLPIPEYKILKIEDIDKNNIYPCAIKALHQKLIHKSDLKAVALNINSKEDALFAVEKMKLNLNKHGIDPKEFLIQKMESIKFETLLGGFRDPNFGPMLMFGSGGKYVEVLDDTAIRSAYLTKEDIFEMISETKIGKLIQGVREEESVNIKNLIDVIYQIAFRFVNSNIMEFDINPLAITFDNQISAVDIRIKIM